MTVGCCGAKYDYHDSNAIIEHNLWVRARPGSAELVSIKSSAVHFRYNTLIGTSGDVDIRAGRHDHIYGNYILGGNGIRLYEDDHRIYNNYVSSGRSLQAGPANAGHAAVKNATIVFNTFLGSVSLTGTGNKFTNNLLLGGGGGAGNLAGSAESLGLVRMGEVFVLTATSRARGAAMESFPFVTDDIQGNARGDKPDVGAQQWSMSPGMRRPLTMADVGPDAP
jgi:poly(beta-D-mannuronate) lyase